MITLITTAGIELPTGFTYKNTIGVQGKVTVYNLGHSTTTNLGLFGLVSESAPVLPKGWNLELNVPVGYMFDEFNIVNKPSIIRKIYTSDEEFRIINKGIADPLDPAYISYRSIVDTITI